MLTPFWGINAYAFLRNKCLCLFQGQMLIPLWGTDGRPFLRDKYLCVFEGQMFMPFWGEMLLNAFLRDKYLCLFEGQILMPFWGTNAYKCLCTTCTVTNSSLKIHLCLSYNIPKILCNIYLHYIQTYIVINVLSIPCSSYHEPLYFVVDSKADICTADSLPVLL